MRFSNEPQIPGLRAQWRPKIIQVDNIYLSNLHNALQDGYSEVLPTQAQSKGKVLKSLEKELDRSCCRERTWEEKIIPNRGTYYWESPFLSSASMWYHKVTSGARAGKISDQQQR